MPAVAKEFLLTNNFKNVSEMKEGIYVYSEAEEHFGVPWNLSIVRNEQHFGIYLYCSIKKTEKWRIEAERDLKLIAVTGKVRSGNLRNPFGNSEEFSDVILIVEDQKFFVLRLFLASKSTFFKSLFMDKSEKLPEYTLSDAKSKDFQNFLELFYGESSLDESTIAGILHLADAYDAKLAVQKCEEFLMENSEKTVKEKLKLAHRYKLKNLKIKCLSKITTAAEIRSVLSHDASEMDPSVVGALLQKSLSLIP
ncbi:hypothetical protein L5515_015296 [Caenorhabditis briggsae]|uniref:BTB domain-containing protein n=1 Tax=Caenorhabditis briggsae TaxID=6238 RepID=A0AAE9EEF9_CAEBR|nr:hypothetical protein L5515_015296 [Caenorhabditis briggsae]